MSTYKAMERAIQTMNSMFVSLDSHEKSKNGTLLQSVISDMVNAMKRLDLIFEQLYRNIYFGGSFYDRLKVGKPDEYDIDIRLTFPKCIKCGTSWRRCKCIELVESDKPGYLWLRVEKGCLSPAMEKRFVEDGFVSTNAVKRWMQSLVWKACAELEKTWGYRFQTSESGPAITILVQSEYGYRIFIDLVSSFVFRDDKWPATFKENRTSRSEFFIVPKCPPATGWFGDSGRHLYWRPSFQEQEREILSQKEKLKPALRLLKKTRSNKNHQISSYYLKTVVLWETSNYDWSRNTLSDVFMKLLKDYRDYLKERGIKYYWKPENNLLIYMKDVTLCNIHNEIDRMIKRIDRDFITNPCIVAQLILTEDELRKFYDSYQKVSPESFLQSFDYNEDNEDLYSEDSLDNNYYTSRSYPSASQSRPQIGSQAQIRSQAQTSSGWGSAALAIGGAVVVGSILTGVFNRNNNNNN